MSLLGIILRKETREWIVICMALSRLCTLSEFPARECCVSGFSIRTVAFRQ